jgi:S1-C subfamily serine protease
MTENTSGGMLAGLSTELADLVERASRSVVRVNARQRQTASGIVLSADGAILTADHVVEAEEGITVGLPDGRELPARLVGRDPSTDLAVLRVEASDLTPAEMAESASARVGSLVLAIARPGESPMATIGVVSARTGPWRSWRGGLLEALIQTDVTLYPGFSGGALVDAAGRVVGLNSSILTRGISTAIPAETLKRVAHALLTGGRVRRDYLGVSTQPVTLPKALVDQLKLSQETGLLIVGVEPESPADRGGLMLGDVLLSLGGESVRDADDLQGALGPERVGQATPARVVRGGKPQELTITVGERR